MVKFCSKKTQSLLTGHKLLDGGHSGAADNSSVEVSAGWTLCFLYFKSGESHVSSSSSQSDFFNILNAFLFEYLNDLQ